MMYSAFSVYSVKLQHAEALESAHTRCSSLVSELGTSTIYNVWVHCTLCVTSCTCIYLPYLFVFVCPPEKVFHEGKEVQTQLQSQIAVIEADRQKVRSFLCTCSCVWC